MISVRPCCRYSAEPELMRRDPTVPHSVLADVMQDRSTAREALAKSLFEQFAWTRIGDTAESTPPKCPSVPGS